MSFSHTLHTSCFYKKKYKKSRGGKSPLPLLAGEKWVPSLLLAQFFSPGLIGPPPPLSEESATTFWGDYYTPPTTHAIRPLKKKKKLFRQRIHQIDFSRLLSLKGQLEKKKRKEEEEKNFFPSVPLSIDKVSSHQ